MSKTVFIEVKRGVLVYQPKGSFEDQIHSALWRRRLREIIETHTTSN